MAKASLSENKDWYAVRTNIRCEEKAENNLRKAGFETYLPMMRFERINKRAHTIRTLERPLMLRYLFLAMSREARHFGFARSCDGVERILGDVDNHPIRVPFALVNGLFIAEMNLEFDDTRAARIHRKEEARTKKETIAMRFFVGSEWLVTDGPFSSFRAEVENVTSAGLVRVLVNIFGRMTPVELEPSQLDHPVKKRRAA